MHQQCHDFSSSVKILSGEHPRPEIIKMAPVSTEDDFDPMPYAHAQMASHILQKGFQSGSLVGSVVVGPILAYRAGQRPLVVSTAGRSALVGVFLSGI